MNWNDQRDFWLNEKSVSIDPVIRFGEEGDPAFFNFRFLVGLLVLQSQIQGFLLRFLFLIYPII